MKHVLLKEMTVYLSMNNKYPECANLMTKCVWNAFIFGITQLLGKPKWVYVGEQLPLVA